MAEVEFCWCCWSIRGKHYEIFLSGDEKEALFRADEDTRRARIAIRDKDELMFVHLIAHRRCPCGRIAEPHMVSKSKLQTHSQNAW